MIYSQFFPLFWFLVFLPFTNTSFLTDWSGYTRITKPRCLGDELKICSTYFEVIVMGSGGRASNIQRAFIREGRLTQTYHRGRGCLLDNWRLFESGRKLDRLRDVSNYENPLWRNGTANRDRRDIKRGNHCKVYKKNGRVSRHFTSLNQFNRLLSSLILIGQQLFSSQSEAGRWNASGTGSVRGRPLSFRVGDLGKVEWFQRKYLANRTEIKRNPAKPYNGVTFTTPPTTKKKEVKKKDYSKNLGKKSCPALHPSNVKWSASKYKWPGDF